MIFGPRQKWSSFSVLRRKGKRSANKNISDKLPRLVIHLGDRKTGSTSIQNILKAGAWRTPFTTLVYPKGPELAHQPLARSLTDSRYFSERDRRFSAMNRWILESNADVAVISAERFEDVDPALLRKMLEKYMPDLAENVHLIAYVRPHGERLLSGFAERVKSGAFFGDLEALHSQTSRKRTFDYAPRFRKWREIFGDRFVLRPLIRDCLEGRDVVRDFLAFALGSSQFEITAPTGVNLSLCLQDIVMLRLFHARLAEFEDLVGSRHAFGWAMASILARRPHPRPRKLRLYRSLAETVHQRYRQDAAALDAEFFEEAPMEKALDLAVESAIEMPQPLEPEAWFTPAEQRNIEIWTDLTLAMMRAEGADWNKKFHKILRENSTEMIKAGRAE